MKWIINQRQRYDLEMLLTNGFAPLTRFLSQADYLSVLHTGRLENNQLWPMPITLDVSESLSKTISIGDTITLCDDDNTPLAYMTVSDNWKPNKILEAEKIFGTTDLTHPGVHYLLQQAGDWYLGGSLQAIQLPKHYDFQSLRFTPQSLKNKFLNLQCEKIIGFQTRNPMHRAHVELTKRAAEKIDAHLLLHPTVGLTKPGDIDYLTRVRCYQKILPYYDAEQTTLSLLPLAMRMAGPKEALWHALIRKNYGCTHFIIGRDHAGPGKDALGNSFYDPYDSQHLALKHQDEMGITILPFEEMIYIQERKQYHPTSNVEKNETPLSISGTRLRQMLLTNESIPEWFSYPEVISELRESAHATQKKGFTIFLTGLSSSGKTTIARELSSYFMTHLKRNVTLLDGDAVRHILSNELGFSRKDRDLNIRRIGFVAKEVTKAGGIALCAAIAPYEKARNENRKSISEHGGYIEVYVSTPLETCEKRDVKGLYKKARNNELNAFTGISDPYEAPLHPEITINTNELTLKESVAKIIDYLTAIGYLNTASMNSHTMLVQNPNHATSLSP